MTREQFLKIVEEKKQIHERIKSGEILIFKDEKRAFDNREQKSSKRLRMRN